MCIAERLSFYGIFPCCFLCLVFFFNYRRKYSTKSMCLFGWYLFFAYIFSAHLVSTALLYSICTPLLYSNDKLHPQPVLHFLSFFFYYIFIYFPVTFFKWNYYVLRPFDSLSLLLIKMDLVALRNLKPHRDVAGSKEIKSDWSFYYIPIGGFLVSLRGEWNYRVACKKGIRSGSYVKETDSSPWTTIISFWTNDATIIVSLYLAQGDVRFKLKLAYILSAFDYFMLHNYFRRKLN